MKKKLLLGLLALAVAVPSFAKVHNVNTPRDQRGAAADPRYGGYLHKRNSGTAEMLICSGRCLLAGMSMGTAASTANALIRNTSVIGDAGAGWGALVFGPIMFSPNINTSGDTINVIPLPVLLDKGITLTLSAGDATVFYLDLDD